MSELKPCPFCGGVDLIVKESSPSRARFNEGAIHFTVECLAFECEMKSRGNLWHITPEDAFKAWNTRADGWISVDDRLPEIGERYHGADYSGVHWDCGAFVGEWDEDFRRSSMITKGYSHWMPLSNPPKGD